MYLYERIAKEKEESEKFKNKFVPPKPKEDKRYVSLMSSMSHTYGNALAYMQNWIINLFPENMFKTIHVNSKIAHRQIRSTPHEYLKKSKPMIVFRPRIPSYDEDRFLKGTAMIERQTDIYSSWGSSNLLTFFEDPDKDISVRYQMNRTVMYVDVVVLLSTLMQQLDYYHYLQNAVRIGHPFSLQTCFESYLPQEMLKILGDCVDVPLYDADGTTKTFLDYMNGHSYFPITYKLQGSTNSKEFYRYYPVSIDTTIMDLEKDDGERTGNVMTQYQISFTVKMEFYSTGFYYIFSNKLYHIDLPIIDSSTTDIIPVFTDVLMKEDLQLAQGWSLFNRAACRLESSEDSINIKQMLNSSIMETIEYHLKNGLPLFDFIDIKLRKQGVPIRHGEHYEINWNTLDVHFKNADTYHTYSICVCLNVEYINNLMKTLYNLK